TYQEGALEGREVSYFPSGELREKAFYENDLLDGVYESWFSPTRIRTKGKYELGKKQGEWKTHELNSSVIKVEVFEKDKLQETYYIE
ncbi:MAG: hypothetical protein AAF806_31400, partial [Bacteroidota bacterium]